MAASAPLPPNSRTLKSLAVVLGGPEFNDEVRDIEFQEGPPMDILFVRCEGEGIPDSISMEVGRSGFRMRTMEGVTEGTTVVHIFEDPDK